MSARTRNLLCSCGSGLKTKHCCQSPAVWAARKLAAEEARAAERAARLAALETRYSDAGQRKARNYAEAALIIATLLANDSTRPTP